jgi:DNA polymerase-3 subunit delta'
MLILEPLSTDDTIRAMAQAGEPWSRTTQDDLRAAAERSHGSVRAAMRLLDGSGLSLARTLDGLLGRLPDVDWLAVHDLADTLTGREATENFETMITAVFDWIDSMVRAQAGAGAARLAPYAEVWEKIAASAREVETYNLDRRPLIMSIFADLAAATRTARS